jgi:hypothetical protein
MLGSAVSSNTLSDFQPNSLSGLFAVPRIAFSAPVPPPGKGYIPVGTKRAFDSEIGLSSNSTSESRMLVFEMPLEVSRNFTEIPIRLSAACQNPVGADGARLAHTNPVFTVSTALSCL